MGFDDIPVGMRPDTVVVRAKAKAPGRLQFKRCFGLKALNPGDPYAHSDYVDAAEPTGYGFTSKNNFRPRRKQFEIDQQRIWLSGVKGGEVLGTTTSKRSDRMDHPHIERHERKFYCAAKTMVVMPGVDEADEVMQSKNDGQPETRVDLARRMLKQQGVAKTKFVESLKSCSNGPNVYGWNELFKFKDHKM